MQVREIRQAKTRLGDAGTPIDRREIRTTLIARLQAQLVVIENRKEGVTAAHWRFVSTWLTQEVTRGTIPHRLSDDMHTRRALLVGAYFALLAEAGLAAWIFALRGVPWIVGVIVAIAITKVLEAALQLLFFSKNPRPKEGLRSLKQAVFLPAFLGFFLAVGLGVCARYVTGSAAFALLSLFTFSLWLGTMSLLVLAAALFCAAHVYGTTLRLEEEYTELDRADVETSTFLAELQREADREARGMALVAPEVSTFDRKAGLILLLLLGGAGATTACGSAAGDAVVSVPDSTRFDRTNAPECEVVLDMSGSVRGLAAIWAHIREELPRVVTRHQCGRLTVSGFGADGWMPDVICRINLPSLDSSRVAAPESEWMQFDNFRAGLEAERRQEYLRHRRAYERQVHQALDRLPAAFPPDTRRGSGSDILAVVQRVAQFSDQRPRYVLLVTDLIDTRHKVWPPIAAPAGPVHLVVMLAPATPIVVRQAFGRALSAAEQYTVQSKRLRAAAPWVKVAPYFAENLAELVASQSDILSHSAPD